MKELIKFRNRKLKTDGIGDFKLPAIKTCPYADECKQWCYGSVGTFNAPTVSKFTELSYRASKRGTFVKRMVKEITRHAKNGMDKLRIHSIGDFYSQEYYDKWMEIARRVPDVFFYAYTKSLPFVDWDNLPKNVRIIQSVGGTEKVDKRRPHAKVFPTAEQALAEGYKICSDSEMVAIENVKVGLVAHGAKKGYVNA